WIAAVSQTFCRGSIRLHSSERRMAFKPRSRARSKSRSACSHQLHALPQQSFDFTRPAASHAHHWLLRFPPSTWWAAVETPQRNRAGSFTSVCEPDVRTLWSEVMGGITLAL